MWEELVLTQFELRTTCNTSVRIVGLQAEIWTQDVQNTKHEC
jgi:hypothetical protein